MTAMIRRAGRGLRHEGGLELVETVAVIGVVVALLLAALVVVQAQGGQVGDTAVAQLVRFIQGPVASQAMPAQAVPAQRQPFQPGAAQPGLAQPALGVPSLVQAPSASGNNPLMTWWSSLPGWVQGALIAGGVALLVSAVIVGLVALGVLTFVSLPVAAVLGVVAVALAAIAGAVYVLWTGRVDVPWLVGIGVLSPLLVFGAAWLVTSGALATAVTWVRTVVLPAIGRGIAAGWRWVTGQVVRLWNWVRTTWAARQAIKTWVERQATKLWDWMRNTWVARQATKLWKWIKGVLDTKFRPFEFIKWEIKPTDVISNLIKYYGYAWFFKEVIVHGSSLPWLQLVVLGIFALVSAYLPPGGISRILIKAIYDFIALFVTGGLKFIQEVWDRLSGGGQHSSGTPNRSTPTPAPSKSSPPPPPTPTP
jgi:hypothetical protein